MDSFFTYFHLFSMLEKYLLYDKSKFYYESVIFELLFWGDRSN